MPRTRCVTRLPAALVSLRRGLITTTIAAVTFFHVRDRWRLFSGANGAVLARPLWGDPAGRGRNATSSCCWRRRHTLTLERASTMKAPIHVHRIRNALLGGLLTVCTALLGPAALAQQAPPQAAASGPALEEVVITGSRIPVPANISATSPTTVVSSQELQLQGHTDISDVINQLPQNTIGGNSDYGNTSSPLTSTGGFTTIDLRGLGPQRTLVLVNGRRLGAGDPSTTNQNVAPDIDQIPVPLLERVDVVTGGASATYGSDAIAGVVNFILKRDFEGIQIDGQYGFTQHDQHSSHIQALLGANDPNTGFSAQSSVPTGSIRDGYKHDLSILAGSNFNEGKGNFTGYFVYHEQQPVTASARDFADCQLASNGLFGSPTFSGVECLGSSNSNRFNPEGIAPGVGTRYTVVGNQFLPWPQAGSSPPAMLDFNNYEYLQRQDQRYQAGFLGHL